MKALRLTALAALCAAPCACGQQTELQQLKSKYGDDMLAIEVEAAANHAAVLAAYTNDLELLRRRFQQAGELDSLKAVLAEVARVQTEGSLPASLAAAPGLRMLVTTYQKRMQSTATQRAQKIVLRGSQYDGALEALQRKLTREGNLDEATAVQAERESFKASEPQASARAPKELKGQFFVDVDDMAVIYLNGKEVHRAPINASVSSEVTLRIGDTINISLINMGAAHRFQMAFFAKEERCVINFRQADCRIVSDPIKVRLSQAEFSALELQPSKEANRARAHFPFTTTSDWLWGAGEKCWLAALVTREMITRLPGPQN